MRFERSDVVVRPLSIQDSPLVSEEFGLSRAIFCNPAINVLGAYWLDDIIGIITVYNYEPKQCVISEWIVLPLFRGHGVGQLLLATAEHLCREKSNETLRLNCYDNMSSYDTITFLLGASGWRELTIDHNYYRIKISDFHRSFFCRHNIINKINTNNGIYIKNYSQITQKDWSIVKNYIEHIPQVLRPIQDSHNLLEDLTLFFFDNDKLIGWLTSTMHSTEEVCVENIYVDVEWRKSGLGITMMGELYDRLKTSKKEKIRYVSFFTDNNDIPVKRLYNLLFMDVMDKTNNHHMWEKKL